MVAEIESAALEMAQGAGKILAGYFGTVLEVEYKDEAKTDPATTADKECQEYVSGLVSARFPDHGFVGEEGPDPGDAIAPDFVWVVDPLDGTINFLNGLPVYASSIGVLYRGAPIAGAVFLPWPGREDGLLIHARVGGGAFAADEPISVFKSDVPEGRRLTAVPASFGGVFRMAKPMRGKLGDVHVTGSSVYEVTMTARGVLQYTIMLGPRLWDLAAGVAILQEAGGTALVGRRATGLGSLGSRTVRWDTLGSFIPSWESGKTTLGELRRWSSPVILGSPGVARFVADNLRSAQGPVRRVARAMRVSRRRRGATRK